MLTFERFLALFRCLVLQHHPKRRDDKHRLRLLFAECPMCPICWVCAVWKGKIFDTEDWERGALELALGKYASEKIVRGADSPRSNERMILEELLA